MVVARIGPDPACPLALYSRAPGGRTQDTAIRRGGPTRASFISSVSPLSFPPLDPHSPGRPAGVHIPAGDVQGAQPLHRQGAVAPGRGRLVMASHWQRRVGLWESDFGSHGAIRAPRAALEIGFGCACVSTRIRAQKSTGKLRTFPPNIFFP